MTDKSERPDNVVDLNALDPAGFRIPASDNKGHSVPKSFRVMPVLANAMGVMMSSKIFPYKTEAELIRHAVVRHLRWLESLGEVPSVTGQVEAANEILRQDQMNEEYQELFTTLRTRVNDYTRRGHLYEARRLITQLRGHFNRMPNGYWKTQYEHQLEEWNWIFENVPKVKLAQLAQE